MSPDKTTKRGGARPGAGRPKGSPNKAMAKEGELVEPEFINKAGRPSKLTDYQWQQIRERLLRGDKAADLVREFDISPTRVSARFGPEIKSFKELMHRHLCLTFEIEKLSIPEQQTVRKLADAYKYALRKDPTKDLDTMSRAEIRKMCAEFETAKTRGQIF